jgi:hypothetical protein
MILLNYIANTPVESIQEMTLRRGASYDLINSLAFKSGVVVYAFEYILNHSQLFLFLDSYPLKCASPTT